MNLEEQAKELLVNEMVAIYKDVNRSVFDRYFAATQVAKVYGKEGLTGQAFKYWFEAFLLQREKNLEF